MKFSKSGAALTRGKGVPVLKMEGTTEAHCQTPLNMAQSPDGGPYPECQSGQLWDYAHLKDGFKEEAHHGVMAGADFKVEPSHVAIVMPVIHHYISRLEIHEDSAALGANSQSVVSTPQEVASWTHNNNRLERNSLLNL